MENIDKIYKVTLKTTNGLKDTAYGKDDKYLDVENGVIHILGKDIDYMFKNYEVQSIEYIGLFSEFMGEKVKEE